jgi:hypothetical protein
LLAALDDVEIGVAVQIAEGERAVLPLGDRQREGPIAVAEDVHGVERLDGEVELAVPVDVGDRQGSVLEGGGACIMHAEAA